MLDLPHSRAEALPTLKLQPCTYSVSQELRQRQPKEPRGKGLHDHEWEVLLEKKCEMPSPRVWRSRRSSGGRFCCRRAVLEVLHSSLKQAHTRLIPPVLTKDERVCV